MSVERIAVLFDAENVNCDIAVEVLRLLAPRGVLQIRRAVGDFSVASLVRWKDCARENGIEVVLQTSVGKGKNAADIRLAIEAVDILYQGNVDTVALVTHDGDFTPIAVRLRNAGLAVLGFSLVAPNQAFAAACTSFHIVGHTTPSRPVMTPAPRVVPVAGSSQHTFTRQELQRLRKAVLDACGKAPVRSAVLRSAIAAVEPDLLGHLGGKGKFQKSLLELGLVETVGTGPDQRLHSAEKTAA